MNNNTDIFNNYVGGDCRSVVIPAAGRGLMVCDDVNDGILLTSILLKNKMALNGGGGGGDFFICNGDFEFLILLFFFLNCAFIFAAGRRLPIAAFLSVGYFFFFSSVNFAGW